VNKKITVIIPVFNESQNILRIHGELSNVFAQISDIDFSILFVNDGSRDNCAGVIENLAENDTTIGYIELSRNFGKEAALSAGIQNLDDDVDAFIMIDSDLQHPPPLIIELVKKWKVGFEIVVGRRRTSSSSLRRRIGAYFFYKLINSISDTEFTPNTTDFRIVDRKVIDVIKYMTERNRMVRGLVDWTGFRKCYIEFDSPPREHGDVQYSFLKLIRLAVNTMTSFSLFPLRMTGYLGIAVALSSFLLLFVMIFDRFIFNKWGFTNLAFVIVINSFLMGIVLTSIGLIALYVGNIHSEVINRPMYVIRSKQMSAKVKRS
jgi:glycosyltransferase involved in cell wall biosynthesis